MNGIINLINLVLRLYSWVMLIYCFMSWIPALANSRAGSVITQLCEPVLTPIRRVLNRYVRSSMIDFSPLVVFLLIRILSGILYML